jgi:hypothetical protein
VGNDGETLVADSSTSTGLRYQAAKVVNAVFNSAFDVWQRGTSIVPTVNANYGPDRWRLYRNGTGSTVARSTDVPSGFIYSAKVQRDSGNTNTAEIFIGQALENVDSARFIGQTVTMSYWAKAGANFSGASSRIYAQIQTGTGTDEGMYSFTGLANTGGLQTITTTWTRYTVTGTLSGSAKQVGFRFFFEPVGTAGADDSFLITGVQLEIGSVATIYSKLGGSIQGELAACQRYYYRWSSAVGSTVAYIQPIFVYTSTQTFGVFRLPVTMRRAPSSIETTGTASNYTIVVGGGAYVLTGVPTFDQGNPDTIMIGYPYSTGGLTVGQGGTSGANATSSAFLGFSAEL